MQDKNAEYFIGRIAAGNPEDAANLMRIIDSIRAERDSWRARAKQTQERLLIELGRTKIFTDQEYKDRLQAEHDARRGEGET